MRLQIFQVDAFTNELFGGNPAAVVPLDTWLADDLMQKIATENNLSETAFFVGCDGAYDIRWFTPSAEVELCGHATLATAYVIFDHLRNETSSIKFRSRNRGNLSAEKVGEKLVLDFPSYPVTEIEHIAEISVAVGNVAAQMWETQGEMVMLLFETEADVRAIDPNFRALAELSYNEVIVTAPGADSDFVSRMFAPRLGIAEDPVTGAIYCSLVPFWAERLGKTELFARQVSRRGGKLYCELRSDRVKIGGQAKLYMKGEIFV